LLAPQSDISPRSASDPPDVKSPVLLGALRFRILKRKTWKAGFRLEEIFWNVLAEAARYEKVKIADYVKAATEGDDYGAANKTASLRVRAVEFLRRSRDKLEQNGRPENMLRAALAAPTPCFVLNPERKLIGHNAEFHTLVYSAAEKMSPGGGSAHLTLNVPIDRLIEVLEERPDKTVTCDYVIRIGPSAGPLRGRARMTLVKTSLSPMLLGYVLDAKVTG
jgi:predicted DNA-binding ribbon-helix-helix protein